MLQLICVLNLNTSGCRLLPVAHSGSLAVESDGRENKSSAKCFDRDHPSELRRWVVLLLLSDKKKAPSDPLKGMCTW